MRKERFKYTEEQRQFIFDNYKGTHNNDLVEMFKERFNVDYDLNKLHAFKTRYKLHSGFTGQFVKGQTSINKGKKWSDYLTEETQERLRKTCFKKGDKPKNHLPVGSIRTRNSGKASEPQVFIKIAEPNKWVLYKRWLWEKTYGEIPKGYVVCVRDGDTTNCNISNLRLVPKSVTPYISKLGDTKGVARDIAISIGELNESIKKRGNKNEF